MYVVSEIDKGVVGGNLLYPLNMHLERDRDLFSALPGITWRIHLWDNTRWGYRWDTNEVEPDGMIYNYFI